MAELPVLEATSRSGTGKGAARTARREGLVPGVIYGGGAEPVTINVKHNELLKRLKAGRFLSTLYNVKVDGKDTRVICRAVQRDVVRDLPTHVDFLRLTEKSRVNLLVHVEFVNHEASPGLKKGGVLTIVRHDVELNVIAGAIPDHITVDLTGKEFGDTIHISDVDLPKGVVPTIRDRDFVIANISKPSGLSAADSDDEGEGEEAAAEE